MAATCVSFVGGRATGQTTHISVVVTGTRGDVLPHIALCVQLQSNGFTVRLVSNAIHHDLARAYDLDFVALKGDPHALIRSAAFRDALDASSNLRMAAMFKGAVDAVLEDNMVIVHEAVKAGDAVLCGLPVLTECMAIGQKYQIPVILLPLLPFSPSGEVRLFDMSML
jgi:UDP:flavonoid glycosyltransferase YjiC (YdhE family)